MAATPDGKLADAMRLVRLIAALTLSGSLGCAANLFLGKWALNIEKSYIEPGSDFPACTKLRQGSAKFTRDQSGYSLELDAECKDGERYGLRALATFDDRLYPGTLHGRQVNYTTRRVDDRSFKILAAQKQTGKVTQVFQFNLSSDDKTLVLTDMKLGEKTPSVTLVYDRR